MIVVPKGRGIYTVLDDPSSAAEKEIIVTIFDWNGQAPVRATVGWNAHLRNETEVGPVEGDEREVEAALVQAHHLKERYGFRRIVIVLEHDDLYVERRSMPPYVSGGL